MVFGCFYKAGHFFLVGSSEAESGRSIFDHLTETKKMPPKAVERAKPIAKGKAKARPKIEREPVEKPKDVYADLPKDLRPTARAMDRIDERRGRKKIAELLERLVQAMERPQERPEPRESVGRPPQQPGRNFRAMNAHLARVRELQAAMPRRLTYV